LRTGHRSVICCVHGSPERNLLFRAQPVGRLLDVVVAPGEGGAEVLARLSADPDGVGYLARQGFTTMANDSGLVNPLRVNLDESSYDLAILADGILVHALRASTAYELEIGYLSQPLTEPREVTTTPSTARGDEPDPGRMRLFRAAVEPSTLELVAEAVAVASEKHREIYVERSPAGWRWSLVTRGGPYPMLRLAAVFLSCDYNRIIVGSQGIGNQLTVFAPNKPIQDPRWVVVGVPAPLSKAQVIELIPKLLAAAKSGGAGHEDPMRQLSAADRMLVTSILRG